MDTLRQRWTTNADGTINYWWIPCLGVDLRSSTDLKGWIQRYSSDRHNAGTHGDGNLEATLPVTSLHDVVLAKLAKDLNDLYPSFSE